MLTYHTLSEFFAAADAAHCAPGELACRQEAEESGKSFEDVWERMKDMIPIFRLSLIHISEPTRLSHASRMPSSA